jgi:hypothetical protein
LSVLQLNQINKNTTSTSSEQPSQLKPHTNDKKLQHILDNHAPVFSGLGKHRNKQVQLAIDETITPISFPEHALSQVKGGHSSGVIEMIHVGLPT